MPSQPYIWFRDKRMTTQVRDALLAAEQRAGFEFTITQGGFNAGGVAASAGTHDGDALDLRTRDLSDDEVATMVEAMRWAGFAAWLRTTNKPRLGVRAQGFNPGHVHAVPNGWGLPSAGAKRQAKKYREGRDGLRGNQEDAGRGHTRAFADKTWPERPDTRTEIERLLDTMDEKQLRKIIRDETRAAVRTEKYSSVGDKRHGGWWGTSIANMAGQAAAATQRLEAKVDALLKRK